MKTQSIQIETLSGQVLAAKLDLPEQEYEAMALFAHCFTCGKDILAASRISRRLADHGFAVLRFDFTGLGASEGEFADTNFSSNIDDLAQAAEWLRINHSAPTLIIGHSLGGTAALAASEHFSEAQAFVTIGSPSEPRHIFNLIGESSMQEIEMNGDALVSLAGRQFHIKNQFLQDAREQHVLQQVRRLKRPLLVMHAPNDATVPVEHATEIFHAAAHPKSFISLGEADHLLGQKIDTDFIADLITSWSSRYIADFKLSSHAELYLNFI